MQGCFRLGLYWQGLTHDLSKYTWPELRTGILYYMDGQSPHNGERRKYGYSTAWLHHKGRNRHHAEYWIDYTAEKERLLAGSKMPTKYVIEMFMDRVAASKTYQKGNYRDCHPLEYYEQGAAKLGNMVHKDTAALLHHLLKMLAEQGEESMYGLLNDMMISYQLDDMTTLRQLNNQYQEKLRRVKELFRLL